MLNKAERMIIMKRMKKLVALALATIMILAMGMTAMAAPEDEGEKEPEETTYTITLTTAVPANHRYEIYQIFTGTVSKDKTTLSNIQFGQNYNGDKTGSAYDAAKEITDAHAYAENYEPTGSAYKTINAGQNSVSGLAGGYYLIKDISEQTTGEDKVSKFVVSIVGNIEIAPKYATVPKFEKEIDDAEKDNFSFAAGDDVPFSLTATLPKLSDEKGNAYTEYKLVFKDTLTNLTFNNDVTVVYKNGNIETAYEEGKDFKVTTEDNNITVTIDALKKEGVVEGTEVIVRYTAKLSEDAESGEVASNTAELEYGNKDNIQGGGTTESSEVKLYTFELNFNKVKEDGTALEGAEFTLYNSKDEVVKTVKGSGDVKNNFVFTGLKAGGYRLEETVVPDGYNKMEDLTFTISATMNNDKTVTVDDLKNGDETVKGWSKVSDNQYVFTSNVQNVAGVTLPSTGGIGTTIFYVVGGIMVLGACVLLITKKRMSARD